MTQLTLDNGSTLTVKDKLQMRDRRDQHTYSVDGVSSDGQTYRFNVVKHQIALAAVRILNWSVKDDQGKAISWPAGRPFKDRVAVIEGLDEDIFEPIVKAISGHVDALEVASAEEKKEIPAGETNSDPSSTSAS